MRIYCDGVFDLFHAGHLRHLQTLSGLSPGVELIVGVVSDADGTPYKRRPVWTLAQRTSVIEGLKWVTSVVSPCPMAIDEDFIRRHKIDAVYHAFSSQTDIDKQKEMHAVPIRLGIFKTIPYNHGISTTARIEANGWDDIWQRKGMSQSAADVRLLSGYEGTDFDPVAYALAWKKEVHFADGESVLDVGCGAGLLGDHLPSDGYVGVEKAQSLADAFIARSQRAVVVHDAESLPFKDNAFDHVISHSMLQYFPSKDAALRAIAEMQRVARKTVFLGDLRTCGHAQKGPKHVMPGTISHILFQREDFSELGEFVVSNGLWGGVSRFNAMFTKTRCLNTVVIGGGPAGIGLLANFALAGQLNSLLDNGVAVIEANQRMGGGSLGNYTSLRSNSFGSAFFDPFEQLSIPTNGARLNVDDVIPMGDLHDLQQRLGDYFHRKLREHPRSFALTGHTAVDVCERPDGKYAVRYRAGDDAAPSELVAENVCVCMGGQQRDPTGDDVAAELAADYFSGAALPTEACRSVAIVGFSHSAFSLGHLWHKRSPSTALTFVRRRGRGHETMPLVYFASAAAATAAGYEYHADDVCRETQRVHRFGGLRGDARAFALSQKYAVTDDADLSGYDRVIVACGFVMRSLPFTDRHGAAMVPRDTVSGTHVDARGRLFPGHQIYAFGLGSGLQPSVATGGEPGCTRRSDGIWLYEHAVGDIIRSALLDRSVAWQRIYNRLGDAASADTPLHAIGGYQMFSLAEWDAQVATLLSACGVRLDSSTRIFESGVGAGAFVDSLHRLHGCENAEGCDTSASCVAIAQDRLPFGNFWVGDACALSSVATHSKDAAIMFGVTPYMPSADYAERCVNELLRIVQPGGWVIVAENNDAGRIDTAKALRKLSHKLPANHLYLPRGFWDRFEGARVVDHEHIGLTYPTAPYRYSVVIHKK